ncbi:DUF1963 domain-containing protein [Streptomyces sp. NPDC057496]|uniref:DUF1963 domain-containing protein n=1 Tax=Streptomyces sp. NPDC057496 TaxID=3346149 RepID=UPI0036BF19A8
MFDKRNRFRAEAEARGVPSADVDRWLGAARPCATLASRGDGPVVGRFGGPVALPTDVPELPEQMHLVATLDLGALPADAMGLPLPSDGLLLLFARLHLDDVPGGASGRVVYVPAGMPVEERSVGHGYEAAELRLAYDFSLPDNEVIIDPVAHPHAGELRQAWSEVRQQDWRLLGGSHLQVDGYSTDPYGEDDPITASALLAARRAGEPASGRADPWERPRSEDWALLAQWHGVGLVDGDVYWTIARKDVAARRFDRAAVLGFFEGPG